MYNMRELTFPPHTEEMAIKLAAFDIMKQLRDEGRITDAELRYIAVKRDIPVERNDKSEYNKGIQVNSMSRC